MKSLVGSIVIVFGFAAAVFADSRTQRVGLVDTAGLRPNGVAMEASSFEGRPAVRVEMLSDFAGGDSNTVAVVEASDSGGDFHDGTIEFDVASGINPDSWFFVKSIARGFAGIAFRIDPQIEHFESIYLRPTNGRSTDEQRRAHAVQYFSDPDYDFQRFREEAPGQYEAPADIGPGEWIHVKIVVEGAKASLFVNEAAEPTLEVNDLKLGPDARGSVGLFVDTGTRAWFSNLRVTQAD